ncbi:MAG: sodium/solute symporter [Candidatus Rokubacteria bacterium]|nr:sodium/solute symporter [Candidatus Rokubacteria bacterium]MBI3826520.1 sodium/solute symporter [Candidatus Rokubacteria bacterium]
MPAAASALTWPDYVVLVGSLAVLVGIGLFFGRRQHDTADFFLARRRVAWWAACLSFLATEISAVTIISVPAVAYKENWEYLQFFVGSSLAKWAVAFLFIPAFYRHDVTTIYEFLHDRFGRASQVTASIFFFVTRLLGSAVRLMVAALAVSILLGVPLGPTIAVFIVVCIIYIGVGGVSAVVWTNVFQAAMFLVAGAATLAFLVWHIDGGLLAVVTEAGRAGRLDVVNWGPSIGAPGFLHRALTDPNIVWVAILNGFFGSMAAFGTDHDLMQRLLTVETRRESQVTLSLTPLGTLLTLAIYLGLGAALFTFYAQHPGLPVSRPDDILPHFVRQAMPAVLRGFMLSAIVLASIDSPLGSLAASFVTDIYRPLVAPRSSERHYLLVSRLSVVVFGAVLGVLAGFFSAFDNILWLAFKIAGVTFGSLLGVFLLGLLTRRRVSDTANVVAMVAMAVVNVRLLYLSETHVLDFAWSWLVILGTAGTMVLALALSPILDRWSARPAGVRDTPGGR